MNTYMTLPEIFMALVLAIATHGKLIHGEWSTTAMSAFGT